jgi:cystathionine gamma-synthase
LEWAKEYGLEKGLVRISVGLEEMEELVLIFERALKTIEMGIDTKDR